MVSSVANAQQGRRRQQIAENFSSFYIFSTSILQKYMVRKKICKIIHLAPWGMAAGTVGV
jgi:hypothetical protein